MSMKKEKIDHKYLGIPNICFSLTKKDDEREVDFEKQRLEFGFDDSETWSLRGTIAKFIIPRLKKYQEITKEALIRDEEVVNDIDSFLRAMELVSKEDDGNVLTTEEYSQLYNGLDKFSGIFMSLWW
jgi:hypothetical protein